MEVLVMRAIPECPSLEELDSPDWFGGFAREVPVRVPEVRYEVLSEYAPGEWTRVLGPTSRQRAEQWWVLTYRDGGPGMRVQEVASV